MHSAQAHHALVERLAVEAQAHPLRYRVKLALLAAAGYAMLAGAILVTLLLSVGVLVVLVAFKALALIKLALVPLAMAWMLLKSLWIRFAAPEGRSLAPGEAPQLRELVERLRKDAGAPVLSDIVITPELNAAAATRPRLLGLLGNQHYLVLGLPLMQRLDRDQFAAVLAHEFGHFSAGHGRFGGWIYRVRASWFRVCEGLQNHAAWMSRPLIRFFEWYAPYFNAYSFVLARSNEYEADAAAARLVGPRAAAEALVAVELASLRLQRDFWPGVSRAMLAQPQPPAQLFTEMQRSLVTPSQDDAARLSEVLAHAPNLDDTHPVLAQRLRALEQEPSLPPAPETSAAEVLLGEAYPAIESQLSGEWRDWIHHDWQESFNRAQVDRERLAQLDAASHERELSAEEVGDQACLRAELEAPADTLALLSDALVRAPDHARLHYLLGEELLQRNDAAGQAHLERVIELDPDSEEACLQRLQQWHHQHGGEEAAAPILERLQDCWRRLHLANRERSVLTGADQFLRHELTPEQVQAVSEMAVRLGGIAKLWIARKQVQHRQQVPHYVVLVEWTMLTRATEARLQALAQALPLDGSWLAVTKDGLAGNKGRFRKAAGEPVFKKG